MSTPATALGLLGGTFDPVHNAHVALAHAAMVALNLCGVRWIPSGRPGHRGVPAAGVEHRLAMLRLALGDEPRFTLDDADARSAAPTYTVNTLARLRREFGPRRPLAFIIGADQLAALDTWRDWQRLFDACHFAVAERPGHPLSRESLPPALAGELAARECAHLGHEPAGCIVRFPMQPMDVSSTAIRAALAARNPPRDLLSPAVLAYIQSQHLYLDPAI